MGKEIAKELHFEGNFSKIKENIIVNVSFSHLRTRPSLESGPMSVLC